MTGQRDEDHGADGQELIPPGQSRQALRGIRRAQGVLVLIILLALLIAMLHKGLAFVLGVVIFIVALALSIMLHEFGHFVTAKKFHMHVTQFFLGFGQTLWSFFRGETEYGVKALPFGGFVRITGMTSLEEVDASNEPRSFRRQPGWQRMIVLAAGSFMHFVFALFLLFILAIGIGQANDNSNVISSIAACVPANVSALNGNNPCGGHTQGKSPAALAGLQPNDKIIAVDGKRVGSWSELHTVLSKQKAHVPVPVVVQRNGRDITVTLELAHIPGRATPYLGVEPAVVYQRIGPLGAISYAGNQFADTITSSASAIGKLPKALPDLFSKNRSHTAAGQVSSVVGVGEVTGDVVQASLPWQAKATLVLYLVASLNIFVGLFNLLPLLPLDGGHLAVVIYERIRAWFYRLLRRPDPGQVDISKLVPVSLLVFAVLVGLGTLLIAADIFNPVHLQV